MKEDRMPSRRRTLNLVAILTTAMVVTCIAGEPSGKASAPDRSDPEAVAKAFIAAVAKKNAQEAAKYVIPEERGELLKAMKKGMPPIPKNPKIAVRVKDTGVRADVAILNAKRPKSGPPFGLDMKLQNGKWWIVK